MLYKEFGRRLHDARKKAELNQGDLAERVHLSRTSITNIEKGRQHISLYQLYLLSAALGLEPHDLLPEKNTISAYDIIDQKELNKHDLEKDAEAWVKRVVTKGKEVKNDE